MRRLIVWAASLLAPLLLVATLVSLVPSDRWWVQALGFPRLATLVATGIVVLAALAARGRWRTVLMAMLALAGAAQAWRLYPYMPVRPEEVVRARTVSSSTDLSCFTVLGLSVLQHNRDHAAVIKLIDRERPDILLLMEIDTRWAAVLAPVLARYLTSLLRPIDNPYGLIFASRLPAAWAMTENTTDRNTPTIYARLATRSGQPFGYVGLHPRPPLPGQDTGPRDAKIERAALRIAGEHVPSIAMGDFNDVTWSPTTQLFKRVGGYLDPRIGRGSYPTFPASVAPLGWPLDQLFVSPSFTFRSVRVLENVGSDHRPLAAELCLTGRTARRSNAAPASHIEAARQAAHAIADR